MTDINTRATSIMNFHTMLNWLTTELNKRPLTGLAATVIEMPPADWEWLQGRPYKFQVRYRKSLAFAAHQRLQEAKQQILAPLRLELRQGEAWRAVPQYEGKMCEGEDAAIPTNKSYFIAPACRETNQSALWILWPHAEAPRAPKLAEINADGELAATLLTLLPDATAVSWKCGEEYSVCGRPVLFWRKSARG